MATQLRRYLLSEEESKRDREIEERFKEPHKDSEKLHTMANSTKPTRKQVNIPDVIALIRQGYSRFRSKDRGYGSIQEKYELTGSQVKELFSHTRLKGVKTKYPGLLITDDAEEVKEEKPSTEENLFN